MEGDWEKTDKRVGERAYKTGKTRLINKKKKKKEHEADNRERESKRVGGRGGERQRDG